MTRVRALLCANRLGLALLTVGLAWAITVDAAHGQRATYQRVSHGHCPCPTPCPEDDGAAEAEETDETGEDLPEVADLTSDAALASASQGAAPHSIGDSIGYGTGQASFANVTGTDLPINPTDGRRFRIANNTSPIPQSRAYYNYYYFDNAFQATQGNPAFTQDIDVNRHEIGAEWAFWCGLASVEVQVPFSNSFDSDLDTAALPLPSDTELNNIAVYVKGIVYQDCCKTVSAGLGIDLPTAEDIEIEDVGGSEFTYENNTVTLSPFVGYLAQPNDCTFVIGYVQADLPVNDDTLIFGGDATDVDLANLLHIDATVGRWLTRDCCGNGVAAIAELHYTTWLDGEKSFDMGAGGVGGQFIRPDLELLNATAGVTVVRGCWNVTPAVVLPLLESPDRFFDYEIKVLLNRMF